MSGARSPKSITYALIPFMQTL